MARSTGRTGMTESEPEVIRGHCPQCGPDRRAEVVAKHEVHWQDDEAPVYGLSRYRILKCRGCDEVFFQTAHVSSADDPEYRTNPYTGDVEDYIPETVTYWPAPSKRNRPSWFHEISCVDATLGSLFDDIYVALNNDLGVLAAIGIRTAFDRASDLLNVEKEQTFGEKLTELVESGWIGSSEKDVLELLTDAGSAAAHRGWKPTPRQLDTIMSIFESFLQRNMILGPEAKKLRQNVPKRKTKPSTRGGVHSQSSSQ